MNKVLLIVGPTGVGKTAVSLELCKRLDAEIVSADSRQVYRYMNIGTAKPTPEEQAAVPHHFIDIKNPDEYYSAGEFGSEARLAIDEIIRRHKTPVVVGGSGLYIRALVDGLFEPKIADEQRKLALKQEAREKGLNALYERLQRVDPRTAASLHPTDSQRIMRALEVFEITGEPFSQFVQQAPQPADFKPCFVGLMLDRSALYRRIEQRVELMLERGLLDEVKALQRRGYSPKLNALQSVGYQQAFMHLDGRIDYAQMVILIKQKTRNYAKRQMTWFKKDKRIAWLDLQSMTLSKMVDKIEDVYRTSE